MAGLIIHGNQTGYTSISNLFIDQFMVTAGSTHLKTYILLLRLVQAGDQDITLARMADIMESGESDIMRSLKYWERKGFLVLTFGQDGSSLAEITLTQPDQITRTDRRQAAGRSSAAAGLGAASGAGNAASPGTDAGACTGEDPDTGAGAGTAAGLDTAVRADMAPRIHSQGAAIAVSASASEPAGSDSSMAGGAGETIPGKRRRSSGKIDYARDSQDETFSRLMYVVEQYMQTPLNQKNMEVFSWMYHDLGMDAPLIEYLVESCVENGHKSVHYMQTVAVDWHDKKILTVDQAKIYMPLSSKNLYEVMNALGLSGRKPAAAEKKLIDGWFRKYNFPLDLVLEACNRTMVTIHEPNFKYVESILLRWKEAGICSIKQLPEYDMSFHKEQAERGQAKTSDSGKRPVKKTSAGHTGFHNFQEREYDFDDLARRLRESDPETSGN